MRMFSFLFWVLVGFTISVLVGLLFMEGFARAEQFGGCSALGRVCAGPSASLTIASYNLATGKFSGGVTPGIGYGVTMSKGKWYSTGVDVYAAFRLGQGQANQAAFSLMGHFADYVYLGVGPAITEREGSPLVQWSVLFGFGAPIGGGS